MLFAKTVNQTAIAPWEGLGNSVEQAMSPQEMIEKAGLDWKVQRRICRMKFSSESDETMEIPGYKAIVRSTDNHVFQVATDRYHPFQNHEIVKFIKDYCDKGEMQIDTVGSLKDGAILWAQAKVDGAKFSLKGGDEVLGKVMLATSHDGSIPFIAKFASIRPVCMNTFMAALGEESSKYSRRHTSKFTEEDQEKAKSVLNLVRVRTREFHEVAQELVEMKVDLGGQLVKEYLIRLTMPGLLEKVQMATENKSSGKGILDSIIKDDETSQLVRHIQMKSITNEDLNRVGRGILESIISSPGSKLESAKGTMWGVFNGVTHYSDHVGGRERDTALQSSWFGVKGQMKETALEMAIQYAEKRMN